MSSDRQLRLNTPRDRSLGHALVTPPVGSRLRPCGQCSWRPVVPAAGGPGPGGGGPGGGGPGGRWSAHLGGPRLPRRPPPTAPGWVKGSYLSRRTTQGQPERPVDRRSRALNWALGTSPGRAQRWRMLAAVSRLAERCGTRTFGATAKGIEHEVPAWVILRAPAALLGSNSRPKVGVNVDNHRFAGSVSSVSKARTRRSIASTMGRTASTGLPAGSSRSQSR